MPISKAAMNKVLGANNLALNPKIEYGQLWFLEKP
jgi:hypothetical protein